MREEEIKKGIDKEKDENMNENGKTEKIVRRWRRITDEGGDKERH